MKWFGERRYSGTRSKKFWKRINAIPWSGDGQTAYMLGCELQNLEQRVLVYLENAENKLRPKERKP